MVFDFAAPGEDDGIGTLAVSSPLTAAGKFRDFGEHAAVEGKVHSLSRDFQRGASNAGMRGGKSYALFTSGRRNGESDFESENGAAGMREKRGKLAGIVRADRRREGERFAVEPGFAHEESGGNGKAN